MGQNNDALVKKIQEIITQVSSLEADDKDGIIKTGAGLEEVLKTMPNENSVREKIVELVLEGLKSIHQGAIAVPDNVIIFIINALSSLIQALESENEQENEAELHDAGRSLWESMERNMEECPFKPKSAFAEKPVKVTPALSLHDVSALLVQANPSNIREFIDIKEALDVVIDLYKDNPGIFEKLTNALDILTEIIFDEVSDKEKAVEQVGNIFEDVSFQLEDLEFQRKASPQPQEVKQVPDLVKEPEKKVPPEKKAESKPKPKPTQQAPTFEDTGEFVLLPPDADISMLGEYVTESMEYLENSEEGLLTLESNPEDSEAINTVFRAFHTIKGTSAFLGMDKIQELAHKAENLLSRMRDGEIQCRGGYADLALQSVDTLKELIRLVSTAINGGEVNKPSGLDRLLYLLADPEAAGVSATSDGGMEIEDEDEESDDAVEQNETDSASSPSPKIVKNEPAMAQQQNRSKQATESSVRVKTDRLDKLIDMVGELVIAQSMVGQDKTILQVEHHELLRKVMHASKIVRELQDLSMSMRMVPLKPTFQKINRLVRDLAKKSKKVVELVTEGDETEIDRNMVDIVNDPLVHMIRNAVDHGIESPDVRTQLGKGKKGTIKLSAYHSGGNVVVEIQDDGKGLDRERILQKAISNGLIESSQSMSDNEAFNLIFQPGFSTAEKVTDISGRGVGMDVVRKNIELLRGRVDIASEQGKGSIFTLRLPLTLAITDGMLVKVGDQRYILPTINIYMSFRPVRESLSTVAGRGEMVLLRGDLMPIFRLHRLFNVKNAVEDPTEGLLIIINDGDRRYALLVDELLGQQQVVAKSLGDAVGKVKGVSGGAILGDGKVGLILDTSELAKLAKH